MYWNVIDENRKNILEKIINNISLDNYYMAGGTALALQNGLRESFDFDFLVKDNFDTTILVQELKALGSLEVTFISKSTLHCILDKVQLTFMYFPNQLINDLVKVEDFKGLYLASISDIAAMKLLAISQRGSKKDFFDLYNICQMSNYELKDILEFLRIKYKEEKLNYFHILKSVIYFEDAEDDILPKTFVDYDWNKIKDFYLKEYKKIKM